MVRAWTIITTVVIACAMSGAESNPPPRIVFLSPSSDAYFRPSLTTLHLRFGKKGNFWIYSSHMNESGYISKGTWSQDSNGIIRISYAPRHPLLWGRDSDGWETYAAIWECRAMTFMVEEYSITNLVFARDRYLEGRHSGCLKTDRLDYEIATGGVNCLLGILCEQKIVDLPPWLLLGMQHIVSALFFVFPILAAVCFLTVKPMTSCPVCGKPLSRGSVKKEARVYCRHCITAFDVVAVAEYKRRIQRVISNVNVALWCWFMLMLCTVPVITSFSRTLVVFLSLGLAFYARRVLYARWLFGHIGKGITLVPKEPKQR